MKIDPRLPLSENLTQRADNPAGSYRSNRTEGNATSLDEVRLSADRQKLQTLQAESNSAPDIRWEHVNALQQALRDGTYRVSNQQVADAMFSELFAPTSR